MGMHSLRESARKAGFADTRTLLTWAAKVGETPQTPRYYTNRKCFTDEQIAKIRTVYLDAVGESGAAPRENEEQRLKRRIADLEEQLEALRRENRELRAKATLASVALPPMPIAPAPRPSRGGGVVSSRSSSMTKPLKSHPGIPDLPPGWVTATTFVEGLHRIGFSTFEAALHVSYRGLGITNDVEYWDSNLGRKVKRVMTPAQQDAFHASEGFGRTVGDPCLYCGWGSAASARATGEDGTSDDPDSERIAVGVAVGSDG